MPGKCAPGWTRTEYIAECIFNKKYRLAAEIAGQVNVIPCRNWEFSSPKETRFSFLLLLPEAPPGREDPRAGWNRSLCSSKIIHLLSCKLTSDRHKRNPYQTEKSEVSLKIVITVQ